VQWAGSEAKERISAAAVDLRYRDEREDEEVGFAVAYRMEVILAFVWIGKNSSAHAFRKENIACIVY